MKNVLATLNDGYIKTIAQKIADLSLKEGNTDQLKRIKNQIRENEVATDNLIKAIEQGKAVDILSAQLEKRQVEK